MKTLNTYITEWRANSSTVSSIELYNKFLYRLKNDAQIKIFDPDWPLFNAYKDKVYIDDEHIELDDYGNTIEEYTGSMTYYEVEIKDINNITNCLYMFYECNQLVFVSLFDTSMVENMFNMFYGCSRLEEVTGLDTSNVNDMYGMFQGCKSLKAVPKFDTKNVENMVGMFAECYKLENVPLFNIKNTKINNMFRACHSLNKKTKQEWSSIYNFETNKQII